MVLSFLVSNNKSSVCTFKIFAMSTRTCKLSFVFPVSICSMEQVDMYTKLVNEFNNTYGKEHDLYVSLSAYDTAGYTSKIQSTVNSTTSGPDVFLVEDTGYKSYIRSFYVANIQEYLDNVTDIELGDIMDTVTQRLRYDIDTNTSENMDPLYGLPLDTQPTAIYTYCGPRD